jgi:hypothetical protein
MIPSRSMSSHRRHLRVRREVRRPTRPPPAPRWSCRMTLTSRSSGRTAMPPNPALCGGGASSRSDRRPTRPFASSAATVSSSGATPHRSSPCGFARIDRASSWRSEPAFSIRARRGGRDTGGRNPKGWSAYHPRGTTWRSRPRSTPRASGSVPWAAIELTRQAGQQHAAVVAKGGVRPSQILVPPV